MTAAGRLEMPPSVYRISPAPGRVTREWPEPPHISDPAGFVRSVAAPIAPTPESFDVELFEALNAEYTTKHGDPEPAQSDAASRSTKARTRLNEIHESIGLTGQRVLEFGCGAGYEVWYLVHHFEADATGVDIARRRAWSVLADDRTRLVQADLAVSQPFAANHFDRILSFSVFEHVAHPYAVLRELHRVLRPGGIAFISAQLHQGPKASHLSRDIRFPWPHLLFQDDVIRAYFARRGRTVAGASWVNRLTWAQYENHLLRLGFELLAVRMTESVFDEEFYRRFEGILGRYSRWDLARDFFNVVVRKPE